MGSEREPHAFAWPASERLFAAEEAAYGPPVRDVAPSEGEQGAGILAGMDINGTMLEQLSRDECLRLMGQVPVGRIVYSRQALPAVELVNFAIDDGDIVIRTDSGGKLAAAARGAVVAFETDSVDMATHSGWSVTIVGLSRAVTDSEAIRLLAQAGPDPWAPGNRAHFIRISPTIVTGRRLGLSSRAEGPCETLHNGPASSAATAGP